ncbi:MAG: hypothetical protein AMJ54_05710 [Deltaproteobacteria bacterium SG8_13]|nr:MAG: hypothetical protein AMJ54_05710 [Deltaproteobacteria bacterium SG8_13]
MAAASRLWATFIANNPSMDPGRFDGAGCTMAAPPAVRFAITAQFVLEKPPGIVNLEHLFAVDKKAVESIKAVNHILPACSHPGGLQKRPLKTKAAGAQLRCLCGHWQKNQQDNDKSHATASAI